MRHRIEKRHWIGESGSAQVERLHMARARFLLVPAVGAFLLAVALQSQPVATVTVLKRVIRSPESTRPYFERALSFARAGANYPLLGLLTSYIQNCIYRISISFSVLCFPDLQGERQR